MSSSRGPAIDRFFRRYLVLPSGKGAGQPFVMEPWQRAFTNYFHQVDANGNRIFRLGILGIPRGNGKSPLAAGYGLYETAARDDRPAVYCISASRELANIVHGYARAYVEQGPLQKHGFRSGRNVVTLARRGAFFEALPASGTLATGRNPAVVIGDEPWAYLTAAQRETWVQMWSALMKREDPYGLMISTAGGLKTTFFGEVYDSGLAMPVAPIAHSNPCLRIHEDRENGILFWWYGIPEELHHRWDDPELWRHANPASWIDVDDLKKLMAAPGFSPLEFQQLNLNMWVGAMLRWLRLGLWESLTGNTKPFKAGTPIWVGVDIGWSDDSSAVVWATRLENGKIGLRAKIWTTRRDQVGEYVDGDVMDLALVERFILELRDKYKIREIAYDPSYFGRSMQLLRKAGLKERQFVEMPPMHAHTRAAWNAFRQHADAGELEHDGDPDFAAHANAVGEEMTKTGPRVTKQASGKIDAIAAAVLAVSRCDLAGQTGSPAKVFWIDPETGEQPLEDTKRQFWVAGEE